MGNNTGDILMDNENYHIALVTLFQRGRAYYRNKRKKQNGLIQLRVYAPVSTQLKIVQRYFGGGIYKHKRGYELVITKQELVRTVLIALVKFARENNIDLPALDKFKPLLDAYHTMFTILWEESHAASPDDLELFRPSVEHSEELQSD
jgi:hypothetical protein